MVGRGGESSVLPMVPLEAAVVGVMPLEAAVVGLVPGWDDGS